MPEHVQIILTDILILAAGIAIGLLIFYLFIYGKKPFGAGKQTDLSDAEAEALLKKKGYIILEKLKSAPIITYIDGKSHMSTSAADFIVEKGNRKFAVKTTRKQEADPTDHPNRRHLIELSNVFPDYELLFVDLAKGEIHEIDFEFIRSKGESFFTIVIGLIIIIVVIAVIIFLIQLKLF